ncbi:MAG TPA: imidazolonepropionase [Acidimicrobiia bacterium]
MARARCSFCGRDESEVDHLFAGPGGVAICPDCVALAADVAGPTMRPSGGDLVLTGISELVTNDPRFPGRLGLVEEAAVAITGGLIDWVGSGSPPSRYGDLPELQCEGRAVIPGFVDPHTHLVFAGDRSAEYEMRAAGASYQDLRRAGGGIASTVAATRSASPAELLESALDRVGSMLEHGTTTVEVKSGYGLDTRTEVVLLEVGRQIGESLPVDVVTTFLGAHSVPPEFADDRRRYVELVETSMIPACAGLASYCDVFCDEGAFTVDESEQILRAGMTAGLKPRIHANQLADSGGADLAARLGAVSADHLEHVTREQARGLREAGVAAVLLPTASWGTRSPAAPARMLWDERVTVALGTDCNPGTSYVLSMQLVLAVAVADAGLALERALWSATRGGALALEEDDKGLVAPGAIADLVVLEADSYRHLGYRPDQNLAAVVIKDGDPVG